LIPQGWTATHGCLSASLSASASPSVSTFPSVSASPSAGPCPAAETKLTISAPVGLAVAADALVVNLRGAGFRLDGHPCRQGGTAVAPRCVVTASIRIGGVGAGQRLLIAILHDDAAGHMTGLISLIDS
jgi:hypothetical protein